MHVLVRGSIDGGNRARSGFFGFLGSIDVLLKSCDCPLDPLTKPLGYLCDGCPSDFKLKAL